MPDDFDFARLDGVLSEVGESGVSGHCGDREGNRAGKGAEVQCSILHAPALEQSSHQTPHKFPQDELYY